MASYYKSAGFYSVGVIPRANTREDNEPRANDDTMYRCTYQNSNIEASKESRMEMMHLLPWLVFTGFTSFLALGIQIGIILEGASDEQR